jgi:hypothetical protein
MLHVRHIILYQVWDAAYNAVVSEGKETKGKEKITVLVSQRKESQI